MARKLRLEYPGAVYHVINRGNYRTDVFTGEETKAAFECCLFEACAKSAWIDAGFWRRVGDIGGSRDRGKSRGEQKA